MAEQVTFTRVQPPEEYEVKGDGHIFVVTPPIELQDADGNVVGYEGEKHRRPIEPDESLDNEPIDVRDLAAIARKPERLARRLQKAGGRA